MPSTSPANVKQTFMKCRLCAKLIDYMELTAHADFHRQQGDLYRNSKGITSNITSDSGDTIENELTVTEDLAMTAPTIVDIGDETHTSDTLSPDLTPNADKTQTGKKAGDMSSMSSDSTETTTQETLGGKAPVPELAAAPNTHQGASNCSPVPVSPNYCMKTKQFKLVNHLFVADKVMRVSEDKQLFSCELCHSSKIRLNLETYCQHLCHPTHMKNIYIWMISSECETISKYQVLVAKLKASKRSIGLFCEFCRKASFNVKDLNSHKNHLLSDKHKDIMQNIQKSYTSMCEKIRKFSTKAKAVETSRAVASSSTRVGNDSVVKEKRLSTDMKPQSESNSSISSEKIKVDSKAQDVFKSQSPDSKSPKTKINVKPVVNISATPKIPVTPTISSPSLASPQNRKGNRRSESWSPVRTAKSPTPDMLESGEIISDTEMVVISEEVKSPEPQRLSRNFDAEVNKVVEPSISATEFFSKNRLGKHKHSHRSRSSSRHRSPHAHHSKSGRSPQSSHHRKHSISSTSVRRYSRSPIRRQRSKSKELRKSSHSNARRSRSRSRVSRKSQERSIRRARSGSAERRDRHHSQFSSYSKTSKNDSRRSPPPVSNRRYSKSPVRRRSRSPRHSRKRSPGNTRRYDSRSPPAKRTYMDGHRNSMSPPRGRDKHSISGRYSPDAAWEPSQQASRLRARPLSPWSIDSLTFLVEKKWTSFYEKYYTTGVRDDILCLMLQKEYLQAYKGFFIDNPHFDSSYAMLIKPELLRAMLTERMERGSPGPATPDTDRPVPDTARVSSPPLISYDSIEPGELVDKKRRKELRKLKWERRMLERPPPSVVSRTHSQESRQHIYSSSSASVSAPEHLQDNHYLANNLSISTPAAGMPSTSTVSLHSVTPPGSSSSKSLQSSHAPLAPTDFHSFDKLKELIREKLKIPTAGSSSSAPSMATNIEVPDLVKQALHNINGTDPQSQTYPTASTSTGGLVFKDPYLGFVHNVLSGILKMTGLQDEVDSGTASPGVLPELHLEQRRMHESMVTPQGHLLIRMARMTLTNLDRLHSKFGTSHADVISILKNLDRDVLQLIADTPMLKQ